MDQVSVAAIIGGVGVVFVVCCKAIAQAAFSETMSAVRLQIALYWGAAFAIALIGCLAITQAAGERAAAVFAPAFCAVSLVAGWILLRGWQRDEDAELALIDELRRLVEASREGGETCLEERCARVARGFDLTRREEVILNLLVEGRTRTEIAEELYVSDNTVKTHIRNLYKKMGVSGKAELVDVVGERSAKAL